jgi:hypothetical protein
LRQPCRASDAIHQTPHYLPPLTQPYQVAGNYKSLFTNILQHTIVVAKLTVRLHLLLEQR